jgi:DNA-binding transcriptional MocR family regulator
VLIPLERGGGRPVFRQIVDYLRRAIEAGRLPARAKLPPIRILAAELGVNRETVADAYRELETLGLTVSGVGRGTFVVDSPPQSRGATSAPEEPTERPFVPLLSRLAASTFAVPTADYAAPPHAVRLERLVPDPGLYPVDAFRKALNHVLTRDGRTLLDYGDPRGLAGLRRVLVDRLARVGIEADADDVIVTGGSTQAVSIAARAFCDPGDAVAVEAPTYPGALASLTALGLRPVPIALGADGLDLEALDTLLSRGGARLVYTMPSFQNPTGLSTSLAHRKRLLAIAARHGVPVLEDEFQKDLRVRGRPEPPLRAIDRSGRVVYVGTFSKALFPGSRVGWIVAPPAVAPAMVALKRASDLASSSAVQAALANFCRTGEYDRHVRRASAELGKRLDRAVASLEKYLPRGSTFTQPEGGFALWVTLPDAIDTMAMLPAAKQAGVVYSPGALFFTDGRRSSALRLSVALAGADDIERGIRALGDVARAALSRGRGRAVPAQHPTVHV